MRYWIIPVLACAVANQAHAGGFIGANVNNPNVNVKAGLYLGTHNTDTTTQSGKLANVYAVQDVALGKPGSDPSNSNTVKQRGGLVQAAYVGQAIYGVPMLPNSPP